MSRQPSLSGADDRFALRVPFWREPPWQASANKKA